MIKLSHAKNVISVSRQLLLRAALLTVALCAQAADDKTSAGVYQFPPFTVTAEKWEADRQKTPISMTAFTADYIADFGVFDVPRLSLRTPSVRIGNNDNVSTPQIFIRGIGTADLSVGSDLGVGFYVDDVYIGRGEGMFIDLFDVERIEVLCGPQGTLYGRNTIGGAINIIYKKPSREFETEQQLRLGDYDLFHARL